MVGVELWAEIRRLYFVEKRSKRAIHRLTGVHRDTITRAIESAVPPRYVRAPRGSQLDPFKDWICAQLRSDPTIQSLRLREMATDLGYEGGKSIFDDYVREVRPRFLAPRTFQRTVYRPGELVQCDLWEPRELVPVGHGQLRRGWVVTAEVCWSRVIAGALVFSKEAPDILWGLGRCLGRLGVLPEKLVWDREGAIHAGGGRPTEEFAAFCGQLELGWIILARGDPQAKDHRRTGLRPDQTQPTHRPVHAKRQDRRPVGMAANRRDSQPAQAPQPLDHEPRLNGRGQFSPGALAYFSTGARSSRASSGIFRQPRYNPGVSRWQRGTSAAPQSQSAECSQDQRVASLVAQSIHSSLQSLKKWLRRRSIQRDSVLGRPSSGRLEGLSPEG